MKKEIYGDSDDDSDEDDSDMKFSDEDPRSDDDGSSNNNGSDMDISDDENKGDEEKSKHKVLSWFTLKLELRPIKDSTIISTLYLSFNLSITIEREYIYRQ